MVDDGYLLPPAEMPDAESIRMTMLSQIKWWEDFEYEVGRDGSKLVIVYDDMCHLLR